MAKEKEKTESVEQPVEKTEVQLRWEAFLVKAEEYARENGTLEIFNARKEKGDFDTIDPTFLQPQPQYVVKK